MSDETPKAPDAPLLAWATAWRETRDGIDRARDLLTYPPEGIPAGGDAVERRAALEDFLREFGGEAERFGGALAGHADRARKRLAEAVRLARVEVNAYAGVAKPSFVGFPPFSIVRDPQGNQYAAVDCSGLEPAALKDALDRAVSPEARHPEASWFVVVGLADRHGHAADVYPLAEAARHAAEYLRRHRQQEELERRREQAEEERQLQRDIDEARRSRDPGRLAAEVERLKARVAELEGKAAAPAAAAE
jgi:hypothetical protein